MRLVYASVWCLYRSPHHRQQTSSKPFVHTAFTYTERPAVQGQAHGTRGARPGRSQPFRRPSRCRLHGTGRLRCWHDIDIDGHYVTSSQVGYPHRSRSHPPCPGSAAATSYPHRAIGPECTAAHGRARPSHRINLIPLIRPETPSSVIACSRDTRSGVTPRQGRNCPPQPGSARICFELVHPLFQHHRPPILPLPTSPNIPPPD